MWWAIDCSGLSSEEPNPVRGVHAPLGFRRRATRRDIGTWFALVGTELAGGLTDTNDSFAGDNLELIFTHELAHAWPTLVESTSTPGTYFRGLAHITSCDPLQSNPATQGNVMGESPLTWDKNLDSLLDDLDGLSFFGSISEEHSPPVGACEVVDQRELLRAGAPRIPGCKTDGTNADCAPLTDVVVDTLSDTTFDEVDLNQVTVHEPPGSGTMIIEHELVGNVDTSQSTELRYYTALDLDNDPLTGGHPVEVGMLTNLDGAEAVALVSVVPGSPPTITPTLWIHDGVSFVASTDPAITASVREIVYQTTGDVVVGPNAVEIVLPNAALGSRAAPFRMQAAAMGSFNGTVALDRLAEPEPGTLVGMPAPDWPTCQLLTNPVGSQGTTTVQAQGLTPNASVHAVFGGQVLTFGFTDGNGNASLNWSVPPGLRGGTHLVTVGVTGMALTANCTVDLQLPPVCERGTDQTAPVFTFVPADVTVNSCNRPAIGQATAQDAQGCGVRITNDSPGIFPVGETVVTWRATDAAGNYTTSTQRVNVLFENESCCPEGSNIVLGTPNDDLLTGTSRRDCILGLGGQDVISTFDGPDYVSGGDGNDVIFGSDQADVISGNQGQDTIAGAGGGDRIYGGTGDDTLHGDSGPDEIHGGPGQDFIQGGDGMDELYGDEDGDTLRGGGANDDLVGGDGTDDCDGEGQPGDDYFRCEGEPDECFNGEGNRLEGDTDCGGPCPVACDIGERCENNLDCGEGVTCIRDRCTAPPTCEDGLVNGTETDVDCGGSCEPCDEDMSCKICDDCASMLCEDGTCAAPVCNTATYEAENMFHGTGGDYGPDAWNIWDNGYVSTTHDFTAGPGVVTVRALSEDAFGVSAHMVVTVGGMSIGNAFVGSGGFGDYSFSYTASGGPQEIRVIFDNDVYSPPNADRNLIVDRVTVDCGP